MGGKTWSLAEEKTFWRVIVPQSPKAVRKCDRLKDWEQCAGIMQWEVGTDARRAYTKLMLFEHYFQNVHTGHKSPCAAKFVVEHRRELDREAEQCDVDASTSTGDSDGTSPSQRSSAAAVQTTEILGEPGNPQCSLASVPIDPSRIIDSTGGQNKYERLSAIRSQTPQRSILPPSYWTAVNLSTSVNGLDKFPPTVKEFVPSNQVTDTSSMQKRRPLPLARATLPPRKRMRMEETSLVPTQNMFNGPSCSVLESGTFREQPDAFASQDMTASDDLTEDFSSDSDSGSVLSNLTASSDSMVNKTDPEVPEKCDVREQGEASPRRSMLQHQQYCPVETGGERI